MLNDVLLAPAGGASPLVGVHPVLNTLQPRFSDAFSFVEKPLLEFTNLRGRAPGAMDAAIQAATGATLPVQPNTVVEGHSHTAYWLGPDEWLLESHATVLPGLERTLRPALVDSGGSVVDVSSGYTAWELRGTQARTVLQKGCPLDLHPRVFEPGQCAQSHFFKASVLVRPLQDGGVRMVVRRSFADYCARMLLDAAHEFLA